MISRKGGLVMKQRVADYIADFLVEKGITDVFTVVGGGAMHLNDAFGQHSKLHCIYNHHEQACAMAAEGYTKLRGNIALVCVTTGPGGTNAMTGVLCAYQDNIPMLVISGQVRYATTVASTGLDLRQFGEQEYHIVRSVEPMTKYAHMVTKPMEIRYHLEKALYLAQSGRRGPVWIDVPLDIQGAIIETDNLEGFEPPVDYCPYDEYAQQILAKLKTAKCPIILAGAAIRSADAYESFKILIEKLNIPVLAATCVGDILHNGHPLYFGNFGVIGGRTGNFMVQNADVILALGCRMSFNQIGFNFSAFAPNAYKIIVDVHADELKKETIKIDMPIHADMEFLIKTMNKKILNPWEKNDAWFAYGTELLKRYPIYQEKHKTSKFVNPYYFAHVLGEVVPDDSIIVVGNSGVGGMTLQSGINKESQRLFGNRNCGTMGYDLPAAIGAAVASKKSVVCLTGDGSLQMNLQELQTVVQNNIPIKLIVSNNSGYLCIVRTQTNFFNGRLSGCTPESGLSCPNMERIAKAYRIPYTLIENHENLDVKLKEFLTQDGYGICEVMQDTEQTTEPRTTSKKLDNGNMVSAPIDELAPLLSKKEYEKYRYFNAK